MKNTLPQLPVSSLPVRGEEEPPEAAAVLGEGEDGAGAGLHVEAPAQVEVLQQRAAGGEGGHAAAREARAAPQVETAQPRLAVGEHQAQLVPGDVAAGGQGEVLQAPVVAEERDDAGVLDGGPRLTRVSRGARAWKCCGLSRWQLARLRWVSWRQWLPMAVRTAPVAMWQLSRLSCWRLGDTAATSEAREAGLRLP